MILGELAKILVNHGIDKVLLFTSFGAVFIQNLFDFLEVDTPTPWLTLLQVLEKSSVNQKSR